MATSFEKVMRACLESKQTPVKKTAKATQKTAAKKVVESKKTATKAKAKKFYESEEDPEFDEMPAGEEFDDEADAPIDDTMDDVADDIMVVVDPEVDAEDIDTVAAELQDIVDNTPDGEVPTTDEYIDDFTYSCPICGSTFFSAEEMSEGDECPVCGETPNGFVLVGQVTADEEATDEVDDEEAPVEDEEAADDEELDVDVPDEDLEPADDEETEGCGRKGCKESHAKKSAQSKFTGYQLDESTFNPFMTKFIRENYKNALAFKMEKASLNKKTKTLKIECKVIMKSGAKKNAILRVEGFNPNSKVMLAKDASRTFKCEGKTAPFKFSVVREGRTFKCEGLKYNYVTKAIKEGARLQVSGNLIRESKKALKKANFTRGRRVK